MKRSLIGIFLISVMLITCITPVFAAGETYIFSVESDKTTVAVGDEVHVTFYIEADSGGSFELHTMQNYVGFDDSLFDIVDWSLWVARSSDSSDAKLFEATVQRDEVFVNRYGYSPVELYGKTAVMGFTLIAKEEGEAVFTHSVAEVYDDRMNKQTVRTESESVSVVDPSELPDIPSGGGVPVRTYKIETADDTANGEFFVSHKRAAYGATVYIIAEPDKGYEVDEITVTTNGGKDIEVSEGLDGDYVFNMPKAHITVSVTFKKTEPQTPVDPKPDDPVDPIDPKPDDPIVPDPGEGEHKCASEAYSDIDTSKWYHEACDYVIENGLMNGFPDGTFEPDTTTSRAMIATMIWRLEGEPESDAELPFDDVKEGEWYTEAIRWAAENGIVNGYGNGKFGPSDKITREQFAAMIYRYEQYKGGGFKGMWMFLLDYTDRADISEWAYEAMCWCSMNKVINGMGDGTVLPKGNATRAHAAQILMNYENLE